MSSFTAQTFIFMTDEQARAALERMSLDRASEKTSVNFKAGYWASDVDVRDVIQIDGSWWRLSDISYQPNIGYEFNAREASSISLNPEFSSIGATTPSTPLQTPAAISLFSAKPAKNSHVLPNTSSVVHYVYATNDSLPCYIIPQGADSPKNVINTRLKTGTLLSLNGNVIDENTLQSDVEDSVIVVFDSSPSLPTTPITSYELLSESQDTQLLLIGKEWIQYGAYYIYPDGLTVEFSDLVRGRMGTDVYVAKHVVGEFCCIFDEDALARVSVSRTHQSFFIVVQNNSFEFVHNYQVPSLPLSLQGSYQWPVDSVSLVVNGPTAGITWKPRRRVLETDSILLLSRGSLLSFPYYKPYLMDTLLTLTESQAITNEIFEWEERVRNSSYPLSPSNRVVMSPVASQAGFLSSLVNYTPIGPLGAVDGYFSLVLCEPNVLGHVAVFPIKADFTQFEKLDFVFTVEKGVVQ